MKNFLAVFSMFPAILQAVTAVETAVPLPKAGQHKLNLILGAATTAAEIAGVEQQLSKGPALTNIQTMVNLSVAALNAAGVFTHTPPVSSN